ncbi:MAG: phosphopantetheine-binding protein [Planctomycetaceae bacterium]
MTKDEIRAIVLRVLTEIAPECDPSTIKPEANLRDQLDLDSMDFQSFVIRLHEELHVDIPERDYPKFATLNSATEYLAQKLAK